MVCPYSVSRRAAQSRRVTPRHHTRAESILKDENSSELISTKNAFQMTLVTDSCRDSCTLSETHTIASLTSELPIASLYNGVYKLGPAEGTAVERDSLWWLLRLFYKDSLTCRPDINLSGGNNRRYHRLVAELNAAAIWWRQSIRGMHGPDALQRALRERVPRYPYATNQKSFSRMPSRSSPSRNRYEALPREIYCCPPR